MIVDYRAEIFTPTYQHLMTITEPVYLQYARSFNTVGELVLALDENQTIAGLRKNCIIELYRSAGGQGSTLVGNTKWFLHGITDNVSLNRLEIRASDALSLLNTRVIGYKSQTYYADKTYEELGSLLESDDMIKAYVRENLGALAIDTARSASWLIVDLDASQAPTQEKTASFAKLLATLQDIARVSEEKGVPLYFDLLPLGRNYIFKTWVYLRGVDRGQGSLSPLLFGPEQENLTDIIVETNFAQEVTYVYVGGYDTGASKVIGEIGSDRLDTDPFSRVEDYTDGGDLDEISVLNDIGRQYIAGTRPHKIVNAKVVDTADTLFGRDYDYGHIVVAQVRQEQFDCNISAISATYENGVENLDIRLKGITLA